MKNRINYYWRVIGSGISFSVFGLGALLLSLIFFVMIRAVPVGADIKHRWVLASIRVLCCFFVAMMRFFGLFKLRLNGSEHLPSGGNIIIANHPSLIDALFVVAHTDNLCCVVKSPLMRNPFTAYIVRLAGYIPNQSDTLLGDAAAALSAGKNLLLFPEGTRNTENNQLAFKRGAANVALYAQCAITPIVIELSPRLLQKGHSWYQMPIRPSEVVVSVYPAIEPIDCVNTDGPITLQARQLNKKLIEFYQARLANSVVEADFQPINTEFNQSAG